MSEPLTWSGRRLLEELQGLIISYDLDDEMPTRQREEWMARKDAYRVALQLASRYVVAAEYEALGLPEPGQEPDPEDSPTYMPPTHGKGDPDYVHQFVYEEGPPQTAA